MIRSIERALNLQAGELRLGAPLFAYLFLVMASYLVGRVVRDTSPGFRRRSFPTLTLRLRLPSVG